MRLIDKAAKVFTPQFLRSSRNAVGRFLHPVPAERFLRHIDPEVMRALAVKHEPLRREGENWTKYLDAERWIKLDIRRVQDIGLDREKRRLRVLDLGSGAGYFLFVCKHLGHQGMGIDLPEPRFYAENFAHLGLRRVEAPVDPQKPLPAALLEDGKFDLVTAFSIAFNKYSPTGMWTARDWSYLLDDLRDRFLKPGGRIYFDLNPNYAGKFMTPEIREMFLRRGARIDRQSKLLFDPLK